MPYSGWNRHSASAIANYSLWLLTCWFYLRSSQTLYNRVMQNKRFGSYVRGFLVDKSISLRAKVLSIGTIWVSAIFTFALLQVALWLKMLLFVIFLQ
ncbi:MAG: YbaN family protein [Parabacteroides chartae]|nr:YbaN family protein [Parabacteroides chartae]